MRIIIFLYCIGYQNYTSVHTNNVILWELPSVLPSCVHANNVILWELPSVLPSCVHANNVILWELPSVIPSCVHTNNVILWELPSVIPSCFLKFQLPSLSKRVSRNIIFTCFSRSGVNQMWILKEPKRLAGDF